ncbi:hypothetical protein NSP_28340 [Nodularia spumigena CCY9414]|nr:hypothetical protein NSP_28340 [Nodularia spumigena CCY9414]
MPIPGYKPILDLGICNYLDDWVNNCPKFNLLLLANSIY